MQQKASNPDASGAAVALPASAGLGHERRDIWTIGVMLGVCWFLEVGGRVAVQTGHISGASRDIAGLLAMGVLGASFLYVFAMVRRLPPLVHGALLLGILCLVVFQLSDIADEFDAFRSIPWLRKENALHTIFENAIAGTGALLLIAGLYYALLELERGRRRLEAERARLAQNVAVREQVEAELEAARDRLEEEVTARTAELAQRNEQLHVELEERARTEMSLARRLRFEEGLAACSHTLQAETSKVGALEHALDLLRMAAGAAHVLFYENAPDPEGVLWSRLAGEAHGAGLQELPGGEEMRRIGYGGEAVAWRKVLESGRTVMFGAEQATGEEQAFLGRLGARNALLLPVVWEGDWRGVLAFINCRQQDGWGTEEVRVLRTAAELLGAFKERERTEEALRKAHEGLERRVAERTADLTLANKRLEEEVADRRRAEREKEKLETQLRQAEKMKAIGTLAGGIAHDFNNILSSILGFTEMTLVKSDPDFPYRRYLEEVFKAGNRAKELVRQILVFSRQSDEDRAPVNMYEVVDEAIALFGPTLPKTIELHVSLDRECGLVLADPVQIHQVVVNLLTNAEHAMREKGGVLTVSVESLRLDGPATTPQGILLPGSYVVLTVSDKGHGIPPEALNRIFEPFFTTKPVGEGTGMGLAIVHGIVTSMGGVITTESVCGHGAKFRVYLPQVHRTVSPPPRDIGEDLGGSEHILVVDDEAQLVSMWTEMLRALGYQVTSYTSSVSALQDFVDGPERFQLALLDQTMPELSGAELARRIFAVNPEFPVILATGFSESISEEEVQALGIRELILKPIITKDLALSIRRALGNPEPGRTPKQPGRT
ncbi:MAG: response regulator [Candidatus Hydrogenedentes bacterium]|nr:response regulator [Candidatus Hydrogenedentota bacterium]